MMSSTDPVHLFEYLNEFAYWYQQMARKGELPRALSGVNASGEQFVVRLDGLVLPDEERHRLIRCILLQEESTSYAYGGRLVQADRTEDVIVLITASKDYYFMSTFELIQDEQVFLKQTDLWEGDNPADIPGAWFLTNAVSLNDQDSLRYQSIWQDLRHQAKFLDRKGEQLDKE